MTGEAAVEVFTQRYAISGLCQGLSEYVRLIDLLNNREVTHLQLTAVSVRELLHSQEVLANQDLLLISKPYIVFARLSESPEVEAKRRETHRIDFVEKARSEILIFAAPFRIVGNAHLPTAVDLRVALPRLLEGFLAMTDAKIVHEDNHDLAWQGDFLVVNGGRIRMVCPSAPQRQAATPPEAAASAEAPAAGAQSAAEKWDAQEISDLLRPR